MNRSLISTYSLTAVFLCLLSYRGFAYTFGEVSFQASLARNSHEKALRDEQGEMDAWSKATRDDIERQLGAPTGRFYASRYPFVLAHGLFGFRYLMGYEYFYKIPEMLRSMGFEVYVTQVSQAESLQVRAAQMGMQIEQILRQSGAEKVNIIGHSMGGLDARMLASTPFGSAHIASITTIGTPHHGSSVADAAIGVMPFFGSGLQEFINDLFGIDRRETRMLPAIHDLSVASMKRFNRMVGSPQHIYIQSFAGVSSITGFTTGDVLTAGFYLPYGILRFSEGTNDGMVSVNSAQFGNYRGTIPADHLDQIGQFFGLTSLSFNYRKFYGDICAELAYYGY